MSEDIVGKSKLSFKTSFDATEGIAKENVYLDEEDSDGIYLEEVSIQKVNDDKHTVFGWANVALQDTGDVPLDWAGDITAPRVLEKAAYNFVLKYRESGEMHKGDVTGYLIESVMFTKEKMAAMGVPEGILPEGWWVGFYVPNDEVCEKIRSGLYKMFSIQGKAKRLKV